MEHDGLIITDQGLIRLPFKWSSPCNVMLDLKELLDSTVLL